MKSVCALVLCAGNGTRMRSTLPKVMHPIAGLPLVGHVRNTLLDMGMTNIAYVISSKMDKLTSFLGEAPIFHQESPLGTAHAVLSAKPFLESAHDQSILVLFGDTPLLRPETLENLIQHHKNTKSSVTLLGMNVETQNNYGRIVLSNKGDVEKIVEAKDATPDELTIELCNSGVMALEGNSALTLLNQITCQNAKGEYYLTDIVALARKDGLNVGVCTAGHDEVLGVNTREDLAYAEKIFQSRARTQAMAQGVTLQDPESVHFSHDTVLGKDVIVEPNVYFGPKVYVDESTRIRAFSYLEGVHVGSKCEIGPFARLRPGTILDENVKIGNFVEVKKSHFTKGAKASHLSYIGDAHVGEKANIGAGVITCNYDGTLKHETYIGDGAFIGSNTALIAPIKVGGGSIVGAGSVITQDVSDNAIAIARGIQREVLHGAERFRSKAKAKKLSQES